MTRDDDNDAWWLDRAEEARREADDVPRRRKLFRCPDRTCGGLDCAACWGEQQALEYVLEENSDKE